MSVANVERVDYEDANRPTADEPTNLTGWLAYYCCDRSGGGFHRPHYLFMPGWQEMHDIREAIIGYHETWMQYADGFSLVIHRGVTPSDEALVAEVRRAAEREAEARAHRVTMDAELVKYMAKREAQGEPQA